MPDIERGVTAAKSLPKSCHCYSYDNHALYQYSTIGLVDSYLHLSLPISKQCIQTPVKSYSLPTCEYPLMGWIRMVSFINLSLIAYLRAHRKHCYFWAVAMRQRFCVNTHSVKNQQSISWPHSQLWPFCTYHRSVPSLSISRDCLVTGNPCDWLWWCPYLQAFNLRLTSQSTSPTRLHTRACVSWE